MANNDKTVSVLFVCLGNICRSPMAEAVFLHLIDRLPNSNTNVSSAASLIGTVDSAGTAAYHSGSAPDPRTMSTLRKHKVNKYVHSARKVREKDFEEFDYIFGMDADNVADLRDVRKRVAKKTGKGDGQLAQVMLYGDMGGRKGEEVVDPYYGGDEGFETAYDQMIRFGTGFLKHVGEQA